MEYYDMHSHILPDFDDGAKTVEESLLLIDQLGAIVGGMIPKIQSCLKTIERGVEKIHIINGRLRHSILLEIFTSQGVGTEIVDKRDR